MIVGQQIGPFLVEKELGSGAMGVVYKAQFEREGRTVPVALKIISLGLLGNESAVARFEREANILKQLRHPNIVRLYAIGKYRTTPFIAMEYIDGDPLDAILARRGRIDWEQVVEWAKQLTAALQFAHEKGIIHRDLKPSNLMLTRDGTLKLMDFGIAKGNDDIALTGTNNTIGTAAYMSPEQCRGEKDLSAKSDLYSLGVVLYELLVGRKPFEGETTVDMFLKHVNEKPVRPRRLVANLPVWLDNLILFLMEKDKNLRPMDAATVGRMLEEIEQKVQNQQSVGAEVASVRRADRPGAEDPLDDEDRDAAKSLRAGKKRKKRKQTPLLQQGWVAVVGIVLVLGVLGGSIYFATRAPSLESLAAAMESAPTPEGKLEMATTMLRTYGGSTSPQVEKAREEFRRQKARVVEEQLTKRFRNNFKLSEGFDPEAYANTMLAMAAERDGDLRRAAELWSAVRERVPVPDVPRMIADEDYARGAPLHWIADRRLQEIKQDVPGRENKLREQLERERLVESNRVYDTKNPEGLAVRGLRFEQFGDRARARAAWQSLETMTEKDPDQHIWYLLATSHAFLIPPGSIKEVTDPGERVARIEKKLDLLRQQAASAEQAPIPDVARRDVRMGCREIVALYEDEPDPQIKPLVGEAKKLLGTMTK